MENDILLLKKQVHTLSWFCTFLLIAVVAIGIFMMYMFAEFRYSDNLGYDRETHQYYLYDEVE